MAQLPPTKNFGFTLLYFYWSTSTFPHIHTSLVSLVNIAVGSHNHTQTLQTVLSYFLLTGFAFSFIIVSFTPLFWRFVPFSLFLISLLAHTAVTNSWKVPSHSSGWDKSEGVVKFMHAHAHACTHIDISHVNEPHRQSGTKRLS